MSDVPFSYSKMEPPKPCPFCESLDVVVSFDHDEWSSKTLAHMECQNCESRGPSVGRYRDDMTAEEYARKAWNNRPDF